MNIVSVIVGMTIAGVAAPQVANMSIQPIIAQKRSVNFSQAEATAVAYAAKNEQAIQLTPTPDGCNVTPIEDQSYSISCVAGKGLYKQSATRSFTLATVANSNGGYTAPRAYTPGTYCPLWDPWGVQSYNKAHNVQCIPVPYSHWAHLYEGEMLW